MKKDPIKTSVPKKTTPKSRKKNRAGKYESPPIENIVDRFHKSARAGRTVREENVRQAEYDYQNAEDKVDAQLNLDQASADLQQWNQEVRDTASEANKRTRSERKRK